MRPLAHANPSNRTFGAGGPGWRRVRDSAPMTNDDVRLRREPPRFRTVEVRAVEPVGARLLRVTFAGAELVGLRAELPAASLRLLLPRERGGPVVVPDWNGNEFRFADGTRPPIRTLTPWRVDPDTGVIDVGIVLHPGGALSDWAAAAGPGAPAAIAGFGRGETVDPDAPGYLIAGDETAIPAITQLAVAIPETVPLEVHVEIAAPDGRVALPTRTYRRCEWHERPAGAAPGSALVEAVRAASIAPGTRVWAAGEAAAMQRIRKICFEERETPRPHTTIRGYWKHGRAGDAPA